MSNKTDLQDKINDFNKVHKIKLSFASPYGKSIYLFIHKNKNNCAFTLKGKLNFISKMYVKNYQEALKSVEFLDLYLSVNGPK